MEPAIGATSERLAGAEPNEANSGRTGDDMMSRGFAILACALACSLALAGCSSTSSFLPRTDFFSSKPVPTTATVRFESEPARAEAKTSAGQTCVTPCEMTVPGNSDFSVTYLLKGYQPQTVPVALDLTVGTPGPGGSADSIKFTPNPVVATLQPAGPARRKPKAARPRTATVAKRPPVPAAAAAAPAAAPPAAAAPAPTAPWPAPTR